GSIVRRWNRFREFSLSGGPAARYSFHSGNGLPRFRTTITEGRSDAALARPASLRPRRWRARPPHGPARRAQPAAPDRRRGPPGGDRQAAGGERRLPRDPSRRARAGGEAAVLLRVRGFFDPARPRRDPVVHAPAVDPFLRDDLARGRRDRRDPLFKTRLAPGGDHP